MSSEADLYIVTTVDREGTREIRKSTEDPKEAQQYYNTVDKLNTPEIWKKVDPNEN